MTFNGNPQRTAARGERGWLREPEHRGGLARYLAVARDHWRLMLVLTACVVGAAILAVQLTSKTYEAEALLTVSPVPSQDTRFDGISVIRETSVPGRDVETLARYVRTIPVAQRAAETEGIGGDPQQLLTTVTATPIGGSYLVSVTASADDAERAAAVANAFASGTVEVRSAQFREQVNAAIDRINTQLAQTGSALPATVTPACASASAFSDSATLAIENARLYQQAQEHDRDRDADDADKNPTHYVHEFKQVKAGERLKFHAAPGGGFVVRLVR